VLRALKKITRFNEESEKRGRGVFFTRFKSEINVDFSWTWQKG
jgi:hypothetical protein